MADRPFQLAIETSGRHGSIALGRAGDLLAAMPLGQQRRHNVALVPGIDRLTREHGASPAMLGEVYVSIGPGSFTGLRVAVATVKMLALAQPVRVVAVPTLDALAQNVPAEWERVAVCLNLKRQTVYSGIYQRDSAGQMHRATEPGLRTMAELLDELRGAWRAEASGPVAVLGDPLPALPAPAEGAPEGPPESAPEQVTVLDPKLAVAKAEAVWRVGRQMVERGTWADPLTLAPLYARPPEAVELWEKRERESSHR